MLKTFYLCALAVVLMAVSALAGDCCCSGSAPATAAQPGTPVAQAQRPQATRSYSYQPSGNYSANYGNFGFVDSGTRWAPAFRPAAAKARGNY